MSHSPQPTIQNVQKAKDFVGIPRSVVILDTNFPGKKYKRYQVNRGEGCFGMVLLNIPNM